MTGYRLLVGDCRQTMATLPSGSVHCVVTSPPYYALRDYQVEGQIGLEASLAEYLDVMVSVFRDVKRVLRDDGTLWLNIGDSYAGSWGAQGRPQGDGDMAGRSIGWVRTIGAHPRLKERTGSKGKEFAIKPKEMLGVPWRLAFALQEDGWYLRQDVIWHKPNPMPESTKDRCTKSHEYLFLLSKSRHYYFDQEAIKEPASENTHDRGHGMNPKATADAVGSKQNSSFSNALKGLTLDRNKRSVWTISTKPYSGAHFATYPPELVEPCVLAGTSAAGCCASCGAPLVRDVKRIRIKTRPGNRSKVHLPSGWDTKEGSHGTIHRDGRTLRPAEEIGARDPERHVTKTETIGWKRSCECEDFKPVPCVVLDPFSGSGTTGEVARKFGCFYIGCELNPDYVELSKKRLSQPRFSFVEG